MPPPEEQGPDGVGLVVTPPRADLVDACDAALARIGRRDLLPADEVRDWLLDLRNQAAQEWLA